jgi:Ca2+-binding RTX toxin-like protein
VFQDAFSIAFHLDGGAGKDTLRLGGDYDGANAVAFGATTLLGVEVVALAAGHSYDLTTHDATVAAGQVLRVRAERLGVADSLVFDASAETDGAVQIAAGAGNDELTGGAGADGFHLTLGGDDSAAGGAGDDYFNLGAAFGAADSIDGGTGKDTAALAGDYGAGNSLTLGSNVVGVEQITMAAGFDYFFFIEDAAVAAGATVRIIGSRLGSGNRLVLADNAAETDGHLRITGGAGDDSLGGGMQSDFFQLNRGGADVAFGRDGDDTFSLGSAFTAADVIEGGSGDDTVVLTGNYAGLTLGSGTMIEVEAMVLRGGSSYTITSDDATVAAGATLTVDGSALLAADALTFDGSAESNGSLVLQGGAGADALKGGLLGDTLTGGAGADSLDGGAGSDTASYATAGAAVVASLLAPAGNTGDAASDGYTSIENLTGTDFADTLTGDGTANTLTGGAGADSLDGGAGSDTASYATAGAAVVASLLVPAGNTGDAAGDGYTSIENLTGTDFADTLTGDGTANTLSGLGDDDTLTGGGGLDTFIVTGGSDTISDLGNGSSSEIVTVASGATLTATATAAWTATAATSNSGTASVTGSGVNLNVRIATGTSGWSLTNTGSGASLEGSARADILTGGTGNDTLTANGAGIDTFTGGGGNDRFVIVSTTATITDLSGADTLQILFNPGVANATLASDWASTGVTVIEGRAIVDVAGFNIDFSVVGTLNRGVILSNSSSTGSSMTGSGQADTISGGSGNDTFVILSQADTQGTLFAAANTNANNVDSFTNFAGNGAAAGDVFTLGTGSNAFGAALQFSAGTVAAATAVTAAAASNFTALAAAVEASSGGGVASSAATANIYDVTVQAGSLAGRWLIINDAAAAITTSDTFVSITGISGALHASDFSFA